MTQCTFDLRKIYKTKCLKVKRFYKKKSERNTFHAFLYFKLQFLNFNKKIFTNFFLTSILKTFLKDIIIFKYRIENEFFEM